MYTTIFRFISQSIFEFQASRLRTIVLKMRSHRVVVAVETTSAQDRVPSCKVGQYFGQYFISENIHRK